MNVLTENLVLKRSHAESLEAVRSLNCWGCDLHDVRTTDSQPMLISTQEILCLSYPVLHHSYRRLQYEYPRYSIAVVEL